MSSFEFVSSRAPRSHTPAPAAPLRDGCFMTLFAGLLFWLGLIVGLAIFTIL